MKIAINGNGIWKNSVSSINPQQLRTERNTFKLIKGIYENHTVNVLLSSQIVNAFHLRSGTGHLYSVSLKVIQDRQKKS